ncbi:hypothetical protein LOTGIDRAFT_164590, partial [Lottia gigantea]
MAEDLTYRGHVPYLICFWICPAVPFSAYPFEIEGENVADGAAPVFDIAEFSITVPENATFGDIVWSCHATDADDPSTPQGQIVYEFNTKVNQPKWFLDKRSCELYVYTGLNYEGQQSYQLRILAKDLHPTAPQTSTVTVNIHVTDINDNVPTCDGYFIVLNVKEDEAIGTEIARPVCSDEDRDKSTNGKVLFKVSDSNDPEVKDTFEILPSGAIQLKKQLDYETSPSYVLQIDVYDNAGAASHTTGVTYNIEIKDIDDNKPTWPTNQAYKTVSESTNLNAAVFTLTAVDADKPFTDASSIKYGIQTPAVPDWFDIDSQTGAVSVKGILNYNIAPWVTLEVFAYSSNKVTDLSILLVNISLTDNNTIAPIFQQISYIGNVTENVPTGTSIITVSATDPEAGVNGQVEYFLTSTEFQVDATTGVVTTASNMDFETESIYTLQIEARDKGTPTQKGYGFLIVNVLAENEFDPVISGPSSPIDIPEDTEPGFIIVNITATDEDDGFDGIVIFSIAEELVPFTIEPTTGILRVGSNLDRELQPSWEITVIATDMSETNPKSASTTVIVNLEDVNDNTPICEPLPNVVVRLPHNLNSVLTTISCTDVDDGPNKELVYTKMSGDSLNAFNVDSDTGSITLASSPTEVEYFIDIEIKDKGNPSRNVMLVFYVIAELEFTLQNLPTDIIVEENTDLAHEVFDVDDCCVFSLTSYEILSGNEDNHVVIDPASGKIILMRSFDRETKDNFQYEVQARAIQTNTTAKGIITVSISDSNDNTPKFDTSFQYVSVFEDLSRSSSILQITATDADIGINEDLNYTIIAGNDDSVFDIDQSGNVQLLSTLDAETVDKYSLTITATDGGSPAMTGSTKLDIEVKNINDFAPKLVDVNGTVFKNVKEDEALGAPIFTLTASDGDLNTVFTYRISQGNDDEVFLIDSSSGGIYLSKLLDREKVDQYNLTVDAETQNNEVVSAQVLVNVLDINDNDPKFSQDVYQLEVTHEEPAGTSLRSFVITDKDIGSNKEISSLTIVDGDTGNHFKIVGNEIQTNVQMNYNTRNLYTLIVQALDDGSPKRWGFARVIITVLPIFKPPLFYAGDYSETLSEDVNPARGVIDLDATAQGGVEGDSGTIKYSIRSGNDDKQFYITDYTGEVKVASRLDFEIMEQYILTIEAVSREDPNLSASTIVTIDIENVNDNSPVFNQSVYHFTINENAGIGDTVGTVLATDLDKPTYNELFYSLGSSSGSNDFSIETATGIIKVDKSLYYRRQNVYNIPVTVDNGDGERQGEALVVIKINDVNDNTPTFTPDTVNIEVVESIGTGLTFYTVRAEDLDTGTNGEIKYTLVSGNFDNQLTLDSVSGALTVASNLDREAHDRFDLIIRAEDKGTPSALSGTLLLTVNVADVNDQGPSFPETLVNAPVSRTANPGTVVITVAALDNDIGENGVVTYEITSGNTDGLFIIGLNSGDIKVASSLTLAENEYSLEITGKDKGIPVRTDTMTVKVQINPAKVFGPSEQEIQLYEELPAGNVGLVMPKLGHATDAIMQFEIVGGNFKTSFAVGNDGSLSSLRKLDREEYPTYILSIRISDNNSVSYVKTVTLSLIDMNDNTPVITASNTNINVVENTPAGQILTDFTVNDEDSGSNSIVDMTVGSDPVDASEYFEITNNTRTFLRLKKPLDFETKQSFTVNVIATDRGSTPLSSSIAITVNVIDIDDSVTIINGPRELPSIYISRETSYNTPNEAKVTQITAEDFERISGKTTFTSINREGIFAIELDGTVTVQKTELLEAETAYYLWIIAKTETSTNISSVLGLLRIDTFDPNLHVVSIESSLDVITLQSK